MPSYLLTAKRQMAKIPKGFILQVASRSMPKPAPEDVATALKAAGFSDSQSLSYKAAGNWDVKRQG